MPLSSEHLSQYGSAASSDDVTEAGNIVVDQQSAYHLFADVADEDENECEWYLARFTHCQRRHNDAHEHDSRSSDKTCGQKHCVKDSGDESSGEDHDD